MKTQLSQISPMQIPTWSWLRINDTSIAFEGEAGEYNGNPFGALPEGVTSSVPDPEHTIPLSLILESTAAYVMRESNHSVQINIGANRAVGEPIILKYDQGQAGGRLVNRIHVKAAAGSSAKMVVQYVNGTNVPVFHSGLITVELEEGARLHLTVAQMLGKQDTHAEAVEVLVHKDAVLDLVLAELGAASSAAAADVRLIGRGASGDMNCLYAAGENSGREMNYRVSFEEKLTAGNIFARGVLNGGASKVMKNTLDFIGGSGGAKGREEESVLVLGDQVVNISAPLLLCGEDNVEGQHATSIGRPDKDKLFYLMSRGFSEKEARKLLVEAAFSPILQKIPLPELKDDIQEMIQEVVSVRRHSLSTIEFEAAEADMGYKDAKEV